MNAGDPDEDPPEDLPQPGGEQPMDDDFGEDSGEDDGSEESGEEEDEESDSDEDLPNIEYAGGGEGELVAPPLEIQNAVANDIEMAGDPDEDPPEDLPQPGGEQPMDDDFDEDSGEDDGSEESGEEEDEESDSDEDLPNMAYAGGGGGELMVTPLDMVAELLEQNAIANDIEMENMEPAEIEMPFAISDPFLETDMEAMKKIFGHLCSYLTVKEIKLLRLLTPKINRVLVSEIEDLYRHCKGKFSTKFYHSGSKINSQIAIRLNEATFHNFLFYRRHDFFKNHWELTATKLETLHLENCSLECEGLKFLVDFAPNLNKLSIKYCKLRDLDDVHNTPRDPPVTDKVIPEHVGVKILHLEGLTMIETCFMQYLIEKNKPNTLTELSLTKCFTDNPTELEGTGYARQYFDFFAPLLTNLILRNTKSLKKLNFKENPFQMYLFELLVNSGAIVDLKPTHISLALLPPVPEQDDWNHLYRFLENRCSKLENLNLQLDDENGDNLLRMIQTLTAMTAAVNCPLKSFNLEFKGDSRAAATPVDLRGLLNNLNELEKLIIVDTKVLDPEIKYIVGGERFYRYRLHGCFANTPAHSERMLLISLTNVSPTFLEQLPPKLEQLCVGRFMPKTNMYLNAVNNPNGFEAFQQLTKLEIRGPYVHTMHLVIPKILTLVNLETLALSNCDIQDTFITGLGYEAIMDLRRCLTFTLATFNFNTGRGGKTRDDLDNTIRDSPNYMFKNQTHTTPRPKLSDLSKLKFLDLSHNPQISDVGIYDSMRLPLVETLLLNNCSRVTDQGLTLIGMNVPSLKLLSTKFCRKMSEYGVNELIKTNENLRRIHTTRVVKSRQIEGFAYHLCPRYNDVVRITIATESEGFICDDMEN